MMNNDDHRITSIQYEKFRKLHRIAVSEERREWALKNSDFLSAKASRENKQRVSDGTHNFLGPSNNKKRVENGTHPWLDREIASKRAKKRLTDGTHHFLTKEHQSKAAKSCLLKGKHNFQGERNPNRKRWALWRRDHGKPQKPGDEKYLK